MRRDATADELIETVRGWLRYLEAGDYEGAYNVLLRGDPDGWTPELLRLQISRYRNERLYPGEKEFRVTPWEDAVTRGRVPACRVIRYEEDGSDPVAVVEYDLPLNGAWSDLTAEFCLVSVPNDSEHLMLGLEEISKAWDPLDCDETNAEECA